MKEYKKRMEKGYNNFILYCMIFVLYFVYVLFFVCTADVSLSLSQFYFRSSKTNLKTPKPHIETLKIYTKTTQIL